MRTRRDALQLAGALALAGVSPARAAEGDPVVVPVRMAESRVSTPVYVCGRGPYRFVIDTGADVSAIEESVARTIPELRIMQNVGLAGVGGPRIFRLYSAPDVVIGERVHQRDVALAGLIGGIGGGEGLLAAGLLLTYDTDLDFVTQELRIWRGGRPERAGYTPLDTEIAGGEHGASPKIVLPVELDGRRGRYIADTGAPRSLALNATAVRRSGLWSADRPYAPFVASGIGGREPRPSRVVRASTLTVGPLTVPRPLVALADPDVGGQVPSDGLVGLAALERMNLSYESGAKRLWVKRNGRAVSAPRYPYSGLLLEDAGPERRRVRDVGAGSPAAAAGVRAGDVVDASQAATLNGPPGTAVALTVRRGGSTVDAAFTLAAYL